MTDATLTRVLTLLRERARTIQGFIEKADTVAELGEWEAAAAEIRFLRLQLTDPTLLTHSHPDRSPRRGSTPADPPTPTRPNPRQPHLDTQPAPPRTPS